MKKSDPQHCPTRSNSYEGVEGTTACKAESEEAMTALRERIGNLIEAIWGPQEPDTLEGLIDQTIEGRRERRAA